MSLLSGFFTYSILSTRRMERWRKPFFIGLFIFVFTTLTANVLFLGFNSFMNWVKLWNADYFTPGASTSGVTPFPLPGIVPAIILGRAQFITQESLWHTAFPNSLATFFFFMIPYIITFLVFDRGFCGWLCPFGGLPEAMITGKKARWNLNILMRKPSTPGGFSLTGLTGLKGWVEWVRYGFLVFVILWSFLAGFSIINIISPALWLKSMPVFWIGSVVVVVFAVVLPFMTNRRWWCYILCPVGSTLSLFHKISLFRVKIDKRKCNECMDCVQECRYFAMTPQGVEKGGPMSGNCIKCGRCIEACPEEAIDISWLGKSKNVRGPFITLMIATILAWYLWFVVLLVSYSTRLDKFQGF